MRTCGLLAVASLRLVALGVGAFTLVCMTSCGSTQKYTIDESAYQVRAARNSNRRPHAMVQAERRASSKLRYFQGDSAPRQRRPPRAVPQVASTSDSIQSSPGVSTGGGGRRTKRVRRRRHKRYVKKAAPSSYMNRTSTPRYKTTGMQAVGKKGEQDSREARAPVVYLGYLKLRVKRRLPAIDAITKLTEDAGGYIQSLQRRVVILRIPADDFDEVMKRFAGVGEVLQRQVKALDVSRQFTDLGARLNVFIRSRERLLKLLQTIKDVEERLRIVQEVKRLSERIESIESTLATLRNLVSYYTITIELKPVVAQRRRVVHRSPFVWVRRLQAHRTTIRKGNDHVKMTMPRGFVLFDEDDDWRAQAADTSILRAGKIANEPRGTAAFWMDAVAHELDGRDEAKQASGTSGGLHWAIFKNKDVRPRYWLVGVLEQGDELLVLEGFFPDEKAFKAHRDAVLKALPTFGGK